MQDKIFLQAPKRDLSYSTLRHEVERIYHEIDRGKCEGRGNIIVDRSAMATRIALGGAVVGGFKHTSDVFFVKNWNEAIPYLNRKDKTDYRMENMQRVGFARNGQPLDGDFYLISEKYKRHPVYYDQGIHLDDKVIPFCPFWIYAPMAEIDFISDDYAIFTDSNGYVERRGNGQYTFYHARIALNQIIVSTSPEFSKKDPRPNGMATLISTGGVLALAPPFNFVAGGFAIWHGIKYIINKANKTKNLIEMSRGAFNISFCGNLTDRPLSLLGGS